jgi:uncharacterized protein with ParB-like and HNH nuclease domain
MSFQPISVREAVEKINDHDRGGFFLPAIQRPYVWGSRYEGELYICKLFDSILRGYPIGTLIIWNTPLEIPFREFYTNYNMNELPEIEMVDKGCFAKKDKNLIYDGQQRLQTLFSCLRYTLNSKVLTYDLFFDIDSKDIDPNETGFHFFEKDSQVEPHYLRMTELFSKNEKEEYDYKDKVMERLGELSRERKRIIEKNLGELWKVFVTTDKKALAYFPTRQEDERSVKDIFQRLNTGGVALSQSDLLFSRIKESDYNFESKLQVSAKDIYSLTRKGFFFDAYNILQAVNLLVMGTIRIEPDKAYLKHQQIKFNAY